MAAKKLKPGSKAKKKAPQRKAPKAGKRSLVPKKKQARNAATASTPPKTQPAVESPPDPPVLPTPTATFVF